MKRTYTLSAIAVTLLLTGCGTCGKCRLGSGRLFKRSDNNNRRLDPPAPPRGGTVDPLLIPPPDGGLPTPSLDTPPPPRAGTSDIPPPSVPENRSYKPDDKPNGKELLLPDPLPGESSSKTKTPARPGLLEDPAEAPKTTAKKPTTTKLGLASVVGFSNVIPGVATGRKPGVEGFDSLHTAGYKTVVYLHAPNADMSAAKTLAEKSGLKFESVSVTPENLKVSDAKFKELISTSDAKPMFVYDDDGVRTGNLWFLYFRTIGGLSDDEAHVRAAPLGLRDANDNAFHKAVQEYLAKP
ncbi:hypothetical protein BH11PLA2_BH11PLA2_18680 [soil metagenome]